jgi:hypothetical protein
MILFIALMILFITGVAVVTTIVTTVCIMHMKRYQRNVAHQIYVTKSSENKEFV